MPRKVINYSNFVKNSYEKLRKINTKLKKFNIKINIKGNKSSIDSVDTVTFFSILEDDLKKKNLKNPEFLNESFFFKLNDISLKDVVDIIKKKNEDK
jgi:hypothetical protein